MKDTKQESVEITDLINDRFYGLPMQKDGNKVSFSLVVDQTKPIIEWNATKTLCHTITTDQIKTARTNPETLEKLFPKVFEKPVVEVGKWLRIDNLDDNTKGFCYLDADGYSYGFSKSGKWLEKLKRPIDKPNYREKITEATLSDLQPLFEAEFNKRYKEGDLLENVDDSDKSNFKASYIMYHLFNGHPQICSNCISIFYNGNFAKVIKSAELIKAEEELEKAKKRVETLNGKESDQYVFVVQNKGTLMIHGSFVTKDKAYKYINGNTDTYHILEIKLD